MASITNSSSDNVFTEDEKRSRDDIYSPSSNYSTYSREIKYIFDPSCTNNKENYTEIPSRKAPPLKPYRTTTSSSCSQDYPTKERFYRQFPDCNYSLPHFFPPNYSRRRTWSPPAPKMGVASSIGTIRSYRSNDQLDSDGGPQKVHIYEDLDTGPPKLTPVSGMLSKVSIHKTITTRLYKVGPEPLHFDSRADCQNLEVVLTWK